MMRGNCPFFSRAPLTMASMMLGWSEPRLTKTWVTPASQSASKKAKEVVYISGCCSAGAGVVEDHRCCCDLATCWDDKLVVVAVVLTKGDVDTKGVVFLSPEGVLLP